MSVDDRHDLLAAVDLEALWPELVGPRARNRQWPCPMPNHAQSGATPPVSIYRRHDGAQRWRCHGCGAGGSAVDLLAAKGATIAEAFDRLRALTGRPRRERPPVDLHRLAGKQAPPRSGSPEVLDAFVEARGWDHDVAVGGYGLSAVLDARGRPRVRFPFRSGGEVLWWQDRASEKGEQPKYLAPKGRRPVLHAVDLADVLTEIGRSSTAIVVEGPTDAIALGHVAGWAAITVGIPGVAAIPVDRVADALATAAPGLLAVVAADADPAGDKLRADLAAAIRARGGTACSVRPPAGLDLSDWHRQLGTEAFADAFQAAITEHHADGAVAA